MTAIAITIGISLWLFLAWQTVKRFPNDGPRLKGWMWFIPFIPIIHYLLTLTGLVVLVVGIVVSELLHNIKNK